MLQTMGSKGLQGLRIIEVHMHRFPAHLDPWHQRQQFSKSSVENSRSSLCELGTPKQYRMTRLTLMGWYG